MMTRASWVIRSLFVGLVLFQGAFSDRVVVDWDIGYVTVNRDGINLRRAIGVNGKLPIPPIKATIGDTIEINVRNSLDKSTSIHAHGLFQRGATHMDGPAMATQCGIPPNGKFTYVYNLDQTGTYWIHGHDNHQNSDGLRAALVVYDQSGNEPYNYDEDILLSLEDWFKEEYAEREMRTLDPNQSFPPPHGYGFGLINGINGNDTEPLNFQPGKTYRLRLVNMASLMWFQFSLPGHKMQVVEVDGINTDALEVDGINLAPAQRYSVLVTAHDSNEFNYIYNATLHANFIPPSPGLTPRVYTGEVVYQADAPQKQDAACYECQGFKWLDDIELQSLDKEAELVADRQLEYEIGNQLFSTGQRLDHFNNVTFSPPNVPTLYTALSMGEEAMDSRVYGPQTNAVVLNHQEVIELTIHNPNNMPHPLHLHGHAFQIIEYGQADSRFPIPEKFQGVATTRYANSPVKRDTVSIPEFSYVKMRFRADNPGVWFFHCHLDIHFAMGMAMMFVEAPDVLQESLRVPNSMYEFCHRQEIATVGNAAGNRLLDFSGLQQAPSVVERAVNTTTSD